MAIISAENILKKLETQGYDIPEDARKAVCLFDQYNQPKIKEIYVALSQRPNHRLDRAEIFIDVPSGYINLSNFSVQTHGETNTCTGKALTWIKSLNGVYTLKIFTIDPITVRESEYYGKIV